jgi:hypothetical protein
MMCAEAAGNAPRGIDVGNPAIKVLVVACAVLFLALGAAALLGAFSLQPSAGAGDVEAAWIVSPADNVCGLSDPRMLSRPARVDHPVLLAATPEMRRIEREGIDPNSPLGITLRQHAIDRVVRAAERVREREGFCSVWKRIRHRDGRSVPDVTDQVLQRLQQELAEEPR